MFLDTVTLHNLLAWGLKAIKGGKDCTNQSAPCDCQNEVGNVNWEWGIPSIEKGKTVENISQFWVTSDQLHLQVGWQGVDKVLTEYF